MTNDQKFRLWMNAMDKGMLVLRTAVRWGFGAVMAYYLYLAIDALAGKQTDATFLFNAIAQIEADRWLAYVVAAMGIIYGLRQRHLRRKNIARLSGRPAELEATLDGQRTSSNLPPSGATRSDDR